MRTAESVKATVSHGLAALSACSVLGLLGWACSAPPPDLAPRLLDDSEELAIWIEAFPADLYNIAEVRGLGRFYVDDNPALVKEHLRRGVPWAIHVLEQLSQHVRPGSTVLDVGAHIGSITVPMARLVGPAGRVYAFEPQRKIYRELVHNLRLNGLKQAVALRFAVGTGNRLVEMDPIVAHDGRVSVGGGGDQVELRSLDSFGFSDVSVIKIDVEGFELEVLRGAEGLIRAQRPILIVEIRQVDKARAETFLKLDELGYAHRQILGADYLAWPRP